MPDTIKIGVITKLVEGTYHGELIRGIYDCADSQNAKLFVINTFMASQFFSEVEKAKDFYPLATEHIDGWIILLTSADDTYLNSLMQLNKPLALIGFNYNIKNCSIIKSDNISGAHKAIDHLVTHGHTRIGFICWYENDDMKERLKGYKECLEKNGLTYDEKLVFISESALPKDGIKAVEYWINNGIELTAIFAGNDGIAAGVIDGLKEMGFSVPHDIAVVGYDNSTFAQDKNPGITTIDQDIYNLGFVGAQTIIDSIKSKSNKYGTILVNTNLIVRKSCGCNCNSLNKTMDCKEDSIVKDEIIHYLEETILKNSDIGTRLLTSNIDEIEKLFPYIVDNYSWECTGVWDENKSNIGELNIKSIYNNSKIINNVDYSCDIEKFPPLGFITEICDSRQHDVIWLIPISSKKKKLGVMAYSSPFNKVSTLIKYNVSILILMLLIIAMDRDVAKTELEIALETLKQAQQQLIQSEKMAALGGLVAGIAHEINTPIGVSVTAASLLDEKNNDIIKLFETGKLKKTDMENYISTIMEINKILNINLGRAAKLLNNFNQLAADQSTEEKRKFMVRDYINEVLLSLNPKIKSTKHKIIFNCEDGLELYASPAGITQIITNLVVNSLVHAFEDKEGIITINIVKIKGGIIIQYSDNGKGIGQNDIKRIYEPFFTTKRGKGGTGLGLNIVYNIVTNEYKGEIKCESNLGKGTTFTIKIPVKELKNSQI